MTEAQSIASEFANSLSRMTEKQLNDEKTKRQRLNFDLDKEVAALEQKVTAIRAAAFDVAHIEEERLKVVEQLKLVQTDIDEKKHTQSGNLSIIRQIDRLVKVAKEKRDEEAMVKFLKSAGIKDVETLKNRLSK